MLGVYRFAGLQVHADEVELEVGVVAEAHVAPEAFDGERGVGRERGAVEKFRDGVVLVAALDLVHFLEVFGAEVLDARVPELAAKAAAESELGVCGKWARSLEG